MKIIFYRKYFYLIMMKNIFHLEMIYINDFLEKKLKDTL